MTHPWHRPAGSIAAPGAEAGREPVRLTPELAGWNYSGLRVVDLAPGVPHEIVLDGVEAGLVPLSAVGVEAAVSGPETAKVVLAGRVGVFAAVTDWLYLPLGSTVTLTAPEGGEVAVVTAAATRVFPLVHTAAKDVPVEIRGAGPATRQVNNFCHPDVFPGADKLVACELLTPDGNWSSYPPHRHDGIGACPYHNEEIYYFRIGRTGSAHGVPEGFGLHRTYTADDDPGTAEDVDLAVRDGDVFLIPRGYHGPCVAAPGYPMYYLNVMAGHGEERTMAFCDDPAHTWVRDSWAGMPLDPRVPMTPPAV